MEQMNCYVTGHIIRTSFFYASESPSGHMTWLGMLCVYFNNIDYFSVRLGSEQTLSRGLITTLYEALND